MSSRICASIHIGGRLKRSRVEPLLKAIREAGASLDWGDAPFLPQCPEDLAEACAGQVLRLCDEQAKSGEFPDIEAACRKVGLGYSRHSEGSVEWDAELVDWRPGMKKPLVRHASNANRVDTYVPTDAIRGVIRFLERGQPDRALRALRELCRVIPELPPFEIV